MPHQGLNTTTKLMQNYLEWLIRKLVVRHFESFSMEKRPSTFTNQNLKHGHFSGVVIKKERETSLLQNPNWKQ